MVHRWCRVETHPLEHVGAVARHDLHHRHVGARGDRLREVAGVADAAVRDDRHARRLRRGCSGGIGLGQRIAQLIFLPQIHVKFKQVEALAVSDEDRGPAGFGSSGK